MLVVEPGIVGMLVDRITAEDLARLEKMLGRFEDVHTFEEMNCVDLEFHQALVDILGNPMLGEFSALLRKFFDISLHHDLAHKDNIKVFQNLAQDDVSCHKELLEAIKSKDKARAMKIAADHITDWERWLPDKSGRACRSRF